MQLWTAASRADNAIGGLFFEVADGVRVSEPRNQLVAMFEKFAQ